jgi:transposase-like protein
MKAISNHDVPEKIQLDGSQASHQAVAELKAEGVLPAQTLVRTNKYLNNMIEQDHRRVKQRCYPMLWFKEFGNAEVTLSGIKLANKIKKGQFDTSEIAGPGAMILQVWEAVLAASSSNRNASMVRRPRR